jgi:monoterpene epsilon-lactone hydrolase
MASVEYQAIIDALWQQERVPGRSFTDQRADYEALGDTLPPPVDAHIVPADSPVPSLWVRMPNSREDAVLIWLHGGGYTIGSPHTYRRLAADLSSGANISVLLPDYRLAPEHPFPAAVDDAVTIYRWVLQNGTSPHQIVIGGDSAGGGLTVATLLALRDQQLPLPAGAVLQSPWADLTLSSSSWDSRRPLDPLVGEHNAPAMADAYLNRVDAKTPLASPVFADLRSLPPLLILVGDHEVLLDDSKALAAKAHDAGVDVALEVFDELHHVWPVFAADTTEGQRAVALMEQFIRKQVGP